MPANSSKAELRAAALARRDALSPEQRSHAAQAIAGHGLPFDVTAGMVVSGYSPIRSELDPTPLMLRLAAQGARLALPAVMARGQSLSFRAWSPKDRMVLGGLGILEPSPAAAELIPDVMLVPLAGGQDTADNIFGRSFCGLGDGAATPVISTLKFFRQDYLDYIEGRTAPRLSEKALVGAH